MDRRKNEVGTIVGNDLAEGREDISDQRRAKLRIVLLRLSTTCRTL